ncbi:MAG: hypothetical protein KKA45_11350 [Alphaproteobacteria bacterium]|nr:hypothetical protein [Alphaproteobacteria bacterium]
MPLASSSAAGPQPGGLIGYSGSASDTLVVLQARNAAFGAIGGVMNAHSGKTIVRDNQISDPAGPLAHKLAGELAQLRSARLADVPVPPGDKAASAQASRTYSHVVVVDTLYWGFMYFATDWLHYNVLYTSRLRLFDTASNENVAVKTCSWESVKAGSGKFTHNELMANNAAQLKAQFAKATEACAVEFRGALGLPPPTLVTHDTSDIIH